jgi:hypothetical protein
MTCQCCRFMVGANYLICGVCADCGIEITDVIGEYLGLFGALHKFRLHPRLLCPGCGNIRLYSNVPCTIEGDIDVTEEFQLLSNTKDSHWVGGRHA